MLYYRDIMETADINDRKFNAKITKTKSIFTNIYYSYCSDNKIDKILIEFSDIS